MSIGSEGDASALENLSALSDGELDAAAVVRACSAWCDDAAIRSTWHAWHLIGDVLRSEDLACRPSHDAAFLAAVRQRLATEPVVLAPEPAALRRTEGSRAARWAWKAPTAVAAGFVLVAGALVVTRSPAPNAPALTTAAADAPAFVAAPALPPVALPTLAPAEPSFVSRHAASDSKLLRDARLERYLAAHQQFAGTTALGVPSGFLRNAAAEAPNR